MITSDPIDMMNMSTLSTIESDNLNINTTSVLSELNLPYAICEGLVALFAVIGNAMVIYVFHKERRLRRRTNYYIVSLATADFLVGLLGIPFAVMASVGLPTNFHACLFTVSLLVVLCTISIFCLVAVSVDRYWAILYPMGYSRNVRTRTAIVIISVCWVAGMLVGFLPLFGWNAGEDSDKKCLFVKVMDYNYLVFLYFATIITPSLLLAVFYAHIYHVVVQQLRQIVVMNPSPGGSRRGTTLRATHGGGTMLRMLGADKKREVKATQNLSIIVLFFIICWIPLYTINCVKAFIPEFVVGPTVMYCCIILSHLNSAVNPLLYAYHLRDFRAALKNLICTMFGIKSSSDTHLSRQSLAFNNRFNSLRNFGKLPVSRQNSYYVDSPLSVRNQRSPTLITLTMTQSAPSLMTMSMQLQESVKPTTSSRPEINRDMWKISEVPSTAERNPSESERTNAPVVKTSVSERNIVVKVVSDGHINGGYLNAESPPLDMEYNEEDDDVFLDDTSPEKSIDSDKVGIIITAAIKTSKASSSSSQLSKKSIKIENSAQQINTVSIKPNLSDKKSLTTSLSTEFTGSNNSPVKHLKLSPLKVVGEFLFQHTPGLKCNKKKDSDKLVSNNSIIKCFQPPNHQNGSVVVTSNNSLRSNSTGNS